MTITDTDQTVDAFFTDVGVKTRTIDDKAIWDDDCCNRCALAVELQRFIRAQTSPLTIGLDGVWGSGKSFFLERFVEQYGSVGKDEKSPLAIYLNAWEHDYLQNPLLFVYHHIAAALGTRGFIDQETINTFKKNLGIIGLAIADKLLRGIPSKAMEIKEKTDAVISANPLSIFEEETRLTGELKTLLTNAAQSIREKTSYPLVVCIDELDRCRPNYAIEMLERIKHCCDIPNVVFILGIDKRQLGHSIQSIYGEIDIENYLRRFIQFPFPLPQTKPADYLAALWREGKFGSFINSYADRLNVSVAADYGTSLEFAVLYIFKELVTRANLTLRQIEDALCRYYRMGLACQPPHLIDFVLLAVISVLKVKGDPDGILTGYLSCKDANAVYRFFFGEPLSRPRERFDMIEPQRVMQKIIEFGMARCPEDFHLDSSDFAQWPNYSANQNFHLGNVLASMLMRDLTNTKIATQSNIPFARSRAQTLFMRTEFHFEPDSGWYNNGMIFT